MALLICAATAKELAALAPGVFTSASIPEMQPLAGRLQGREAIFLVTGVGPVNAALSAGYCLGLAHGGHVGGEAKTVDAVLCAGVAGAFDLGAAPLLSVWRVSEEIWPEYGLNDGVRVTARAFSYPLWPRGGEDIYDRLELSPLAALGCGEKPEQWRAGASLTVAGVTASFGRRDALWNAYRAPLENMEGFAVAYACARASVPCVEIRIVANKVGPRGRDEKDFDGAIRALGGILPALGLA